MGTFSDLDSVRQHRERAFGWVMSEVADQLHVALADADTDTKSPIEAIFYLWWEALTIAGCGRNMGLALHTQHETSVNDRSYFLDFKVTPSDVDTWLEGVKMGVDFPNIGVEMDGHDFHERTKDQVAHRNERDRDLQAGGWKILHFSGTELYRDPIRVVGEVADVGRFHWLAFSRQLRAAKRSRGDYGR